MSEQPSGPFSHWQQAIQMGGQEPEEPEVRGGLPPFFQFSQNSLQDYADCARRFQLRYMAGQRWPAAESEPIEEHERFMAQGSEFHRLVQRHVKFGSATLPGIPAEKLTPTDYPLAEWWDAYLSYPPPDLPEAVRLAEAELSTPLAGFRLLAKFDLLAIAPGERATIVDWKTTRSRPPRDTLARRLQTRVYPFVLVEAGAGLFGGPLDPEQVTLLYWFASAPAQPEIFRYTVPQHEDNRAYLGGLIEEILGRGEPTWPLTDDEHHCRYCVYRSLCDRGAQAGRLEEAGLAAGEVDVDFDFALDLDDLDEIKF